jgi:predicted phosphodiesterase
MRIVCISDTHLAHEKANIKIPDGNILIHAGDATYEGSVEEMTAFNRWFSHFHHKHKILIAGNHDWLFQKDPALATSILSPSINYLQDSSIQIRDLKIYGSPWQPEFLNWAFNLPRGPRLREKWKLIPNNTDILITHGPPAGILDETPDGENVGCEELHEALARIKPKLHVFGHVHHGYGTLEVSGTKFVNASICDEAYLPSHSAIVVDL